MKKIIIIQWCMVLLLSASALAAPINIQVEPASTGPINFNDEVLLKVFIEPNNINLLAATAVFRINGGFTFVDDPLLISTGTIFTPLDTNQIISGAWTMDGTAAGGTAISISDNRRLLGQLKVSAPESGNLQLELDRDASEFWESRTVRHTLGEVTVSPLTVTEEEEDEITDEGCERNDECTGEQSCIQSLCTTILTFIRNILENDLSVIQKVSAIARVLQQTELI